MLMIKQGIERQVAETKVAEYAAKGYKPLTVKKPVKKAGVKK